MFVMPWPIGWFKGLIGQLPGFRMLFIRTVLLVGVFVGGSMCLQDEYSSYA